MTTDKYAFGSTISRASDYNGGFGFGPMMKISDDDYNNMLRDNGTAKAVKSKEVQVGGDHYKKAGNNMQPWDIIDAWELDYYAGTVLKYLLRYKHKNGKEDLEKARHFLDKMIEDYEDAT